MNGEIEEISSDVLRGVVPHKHLLSDVSKHVFQVCSEFSHVHSTQCHVKSNVG